MENHDVYVSSYIYSAEDGPDLGQEYGGNGDYDARFTADDEGTVDTDKYEGSMEPRDDDNQNDTDNGDENDADKSDSK